jgi:predicted XRE-type DNA-binding protein
MAKKFNELRSRMSPERQQRNKAEADRVLLEMSLQELRLNVSHLSQDDIAEILRVTQGYVSKLERQDDMLISRLYAYVEALGGSLELRASFPQHEEIHIKGYGEIEKLRAALTPTGKRKESA